VLSIHSSIGFWKLQSSCWIRNVNCEIHSLSMIKQYYLEEFQVRAIFVPAEHRRELAALSETPQPVRIYYRLGTERHPKKLGIPKLSSQLVGTFACEPDRWVSIHNVGELLIIDRVSFTLASGVVYYPLQLQLV
jgi:hypothetical protein